MRESGTPEDAYGKKNGKKGEITSKTLVTTLIVIIGFVIVVLVYSVINWTGTVDREVCHQSVVYRGTLPSTFNAKDYVPLKCKTEKICITSGLFAGKCDEYENAKGVTTIKVSNKKDIEKIITQNIVDCWSMMGEGKLSLFSKWKEKYGIGGVYPSCVICNRIAFDKDKLSGAGIDLSELDVLEYAQTHLIPDGKVTYYQYLAGENEGKISIGDNINFKELKEENGQLVEGTGEVSLKVYQIDEIDKVESNKETKELAVLFMQISAPGQGEALKNAFEFAGLAWGVSFITAPIGTIKATTEAVSSVYTYVLAAVGIGLQQLNVAVNRGVTAGYCGDISTGENARSGCSVVRTVNYNEEDIGSYCKVIESIP